MPEVASLPLQSIRTGWLNQPLWSGFRPGVGGLTVGPVPSYLTTKLSEELLPALSVQLPLLGAPPVSGPE